MDYTLPKLRAELAEAAQSILGVTKLMVDDARAEQGADLAIPCFGAASKLKQDPQSLATKLAAELKHDLVANIAAAGGYANIWLKADELSRLVVEQAGGDNYGHNQTRDGQTILVEHTDPNPFKELHIGHIYSNTVGEAICRLLEASGARVHRVSYQGDVGLHIAKAVWSAGRSIGWEAGRIGELSSDIGSYYSEGAEAFEQDETAKKEIADINKKIYDGSDANIKAVYDWGKQASFDYFDQVYTRLKVPAFEKQYLESQSGPAGLELVQANMDKFERSDGAVVFRGEEKGEHTRVFITSEGLPTYESKELGLAVLKDQDYPDASLSVVITANEINAYFKVVLSALSQIKPELANKTKHLSHGLVKLPSGKMSSRTGDVIKAIDLLDEVTAAVKKRAPQSPSAEDNALAAVKYAFLRPNIGGDIVYDVEESIKLDGQTGPYIQYAAVRINSILAKVSSGAATSGYDWQTEKNLLLLTARFPEVVLSATQELAPSKIAHFAYELAKEFNRYYEAVPVKDAKDNVKAARLTALQAVHGTLSQALGLMNIAVPPKM